MAVTSASLKKLLRWFEHSARDLPWRRTSDPYKIWISEIMLQQTGVSVVIPYYERFISRFPSLKDLAAGEEREILKLWEGLGYYSRARNLRRAAQMLVQEFHGEFPQEREELLRLPGIGQYTAGAILSIAFRKPAAALDGNIIRVYSRLTALKKNVSEPTVLKSLWAMARENVQKVQGHPREFTEALMELGATICTPRNPRCELCPWRAECEARKQNCQNKLPVKSKARAREKYIEVVWFKRAGTKIQFLKRGGDVRYPHFHRLPNSAVAQAPKKFLLKQKYSITHRDYEVYVCQTKGRLRNAEWISEEKLSSLLLPSIDRRILKELVA